MNSLYQFKQPSRLPSTLRRQQLCKHRVPRERMTKTEATRLGDQQLGVDCAVQQLEHAILVQTTRLGQKRPLEPSTEQCCQPQQMRYFLSQLSESSADRFTERKRHDRSRQVVDL